MIPERPAPRAPPSRALATRQLILGTLVAVGGVALLPAGAWSMGLPLLVFGGLLAGLGVMVRTSGEAAPIVNRAYNAIIGGRAAEAEQILDEAEGRFQLGYIRRVIDLLRASIAMRRGDLGAALVRAEAALARRPGLLTRSQEHGHLAGARAMRALLRASLGDHEGARADAAVVRVDLDAPVEALARAEVAEAVALERSGDRAALAAHLARKRTLLLDYTVPRERAIVRAYQRMLKAPRTSVYRHAAVRDAEEAKAGEPSVADWIAKIAPAAAPFARSARARGKDTGGAAAPPEEIEGGLLRGVEDRLATKGVKPTTRHRARLVALWLVLIGLFVAFWQFLAPVPGVAAADPAAFTSFDPGPVFALLVALLVGVVVAKTARNLRHDRRVAAAAAALARGDEDAVAELFAVTRSPYSVASAQAYFQLALLAERRGDFREALKRCDHGIAVATQRESTRAFTSSILLPDLVAERAFVLAATDRHEKASAEMAVLRDAFPAYPYRARAELRVALVQRARRGDLDGAAALVAGNIDDLPLSLRDETLADLVRAVGRPEAAGAGEVERLKEEVRLDADLRRWLEKVAPAVLAAFEAPARVEAPEAVEASAAVEAPAAVEALAAVEEGEQVERRDAEAEREALAAEEAPRAVRRA